MADEQEILTITEGHETIESWINRDFISDETRKELEGANLLLVPQMGFGEFDKPVFPVCTEEIYAYIRENAPEGIKAEICINEADYHALALHSGLLVLGHMLVTSGVCSIGFSLISEYLKRRIWSSGDDKAKAKLTLTVINADGSSKTLTYDGPAKQLEETVRAALPPAPESPAPPQLENQ